MLHQRQREPLDKVFSRKYAKIYFKRVDCNRQVASHGRSYVRVIVVTVIVFMDELPNKTASSNP
jgi:hypothetical protein